MMENQQDVNHKNSDCGKPSHQHSTQTLTTVLDLYMRGVVAYQTGQYNEAISCLTQALQQINDLPIPPEIIKKFLKLIFLMRGDTYLLLNQAEKALADFNAILSEDPGDKKILMNTASACLKLSQADKALADYNVGIDYYEQKRTQDQASPDELTTLSQFYLQRGTLFQQKRQNINAAVHDFERVVQLDPNNENARNALASLKNQMKLS